MDKRTKGKIINALRRLTFAYEPRNKAKASKKVAPATFECEHCSNWIYEGTKSLDKLDLSCPTELVKGKVYCDHIDAVIPLNGFSEGAWSWDEFIERLFCEQDQIQILCAPCHKIKTDLENGMRKEYRKSKKKP